MIGTRPGIAFATLVTLVFLGPSAASAEVLSFPRDVRRAAVDACDDPLRDDDCDAWLDCPCPTCGDEAGTCGHAGSDFPEDVQRVFGGVCGDVLPDPGEECDPPGILGSCDCCDAGGAPGCADGLCALLVCDVDPACCSVAWDAACAALALQLPDCRVCCTADRACTGDCCIDSDGDGSCDDADPCPLTATMGAAPPVFDQTFLALADRVTFAWTKAESITWVRGDLALVSSYDVAATGSASGALSFSDATTPPAGAGFYYVARPRCAAGSWTSGGDGEQPGRDGQLPATGANGDTCLSRLDCVSGICDDGVCCPTPCSGFCLSCGLPGTEGTCVSSFGYDPNDDCPGASVCEGGTGSCTPNDGDPCTTEADCTSLSCVDGVCCGSPCNEFCSSCAEPGTEGVCVRLTGTDPDDECPGSSVCDEPTGGCTDNVGDPCTTADECANAIQCVDGFCCNAACDGLCESCDIPGLEGDCTAIPIGTDPDDECPGTSVCDGPTGGCLENVGDPCAMGADCTSELCEDGFCCDVACGVCGDCSQPGSEGTCFFTPAGTDPGDLCPGTSVCGAGGDCLPNDGDPCSFPGDCTSGFCTDSTCCLPAAETCNDVDDDCNGQPDDGLPADELEPNDACDGVAFGGPFGSDATGFGTATVYPQGDVDIYRFELQETDSNCACCDGAPICADEDYRLILDLTVPDGAGSYEICVTTDACGTWQTCKEVLAGATLSVPVLLDGSCFETDTYTAFVRVLGRAAPGFECVPYTLAFFFDALVCN